MAGKCLCTDIYIYILELNMIILYYFLILNDLNPFTVTVNETFVLILIYCRYKSIVA
jgi:hypothetical protein